MLFKRKLKRHELNFSKALKLVRCDMQLNDPMIRTVYYNVLKVLMKVINFVLVHFYHMKLTSFQHSYKSFQFTKLLWGCFFQNKSDQYIYNYI